MFSILNAVILSMTIVITREEIEVSLPAGTSSAEVVSYLASVGEDYSYYTRETDRVITPAFPWREDEVGYYSTLIENVKPAWWFPSLGGVYRVRVGVTADGQSTQVVIEGGVIKS